MRPDVVKMLKTELPRETTVPLHLTVDPWWDLVTAIAFGRVDDGLPPEQFVPLEEDDRIVFVLDAPGEGPVIGFTVDEPSAIDVAALESAEVWAGPRFDVPTLGLTGATVAEILLAVGARFEDGEPTAGALHFHLAIGDAVEDGEESSDLDTTIGQWQLALEAGEMKALFGLGYTLVGAGRPREAYDALRRYTELTPHNAWAWCWLAQACSAMGDVAEARSAFERALECEREGSFETDAADLLEELGP